MTRYLRLFILLALGLLPCTEGRAADFPPSNAVSLDVPVYLGRQEQGMAHMLITPDSGKSYVRMEPVLAALQSLVPEEKLRAIEASAVEGYIRLETVAQAGVDVWFDDRLVGIVMEVPAENRGVQSLSARHRYDLSHRSVTEQSPVSAYANFRGAQDYVGSGIEGQEGRQDFRMSTDGALNMNGWVLEGAGDYLENSDRPWARGDVRLVHDLPEDMVRLAAGDLSYPVTGFQSFQRMGGVTVARNFDLQPYRVSEPTGQTSFFLKSPSRVDILVNGRRVQTLQLDAGPFDISDFPVVTGSNDVEILITDATGRTEVKSFDIVSGTNLLAAGLHKYAYNIGVDSNVENREIRYDTGQPVLSAFHRYGVTDALTLGANLQGDQDQQMGGLETTFGAKWGILRTDVAGSHVENGDSGFAVRNQYRLIQHGGVDEKGTFTGARALTASVEYRDEKFAPLGTLQPDNPFSWNLAARYSLQYSPTINFGVGGRYEIGRGDQENDWTASLSMNKRLPKNLNLNVSFEQRRDEGAGAFVTLTWTPRGTRHSVTSSYDSFTKTKRADWNYAEEGRSNSFSASAGAARTDDRDQFTGDLTYYNNRGEISARQDVVTPFGDDGASDKTQSRSQVNFGTAVAYSGGHVALSRPISNSFAMVAPHPALAGHDIGVNEQGSREGEPTYEAQADGFGPAVLPDITPYLYRRVRIDSGNLPPGFDAGEDSYTLYPGYRSGTLIEIGSGANVLLDGTLQYPDGSPVALQAGSITSVTDANIAPPFFSNRAGRFRIEKLKPGVYEMELFRFPGVKIPVSIPENAAGPTQAGMLTLAVGPDEEGEGP